jgi:hypothetical protein
MSSALAGLMGGVALMAMGGGAVAQAVRSGDTVHTTQAWLSDSDSFLVYGNLPDVGMVSDTHTVGLIDQTGTDMTHDTQVQIDSLCFDIYDPITTGPGINSPAPVDYTFTTGALGGGGSPYVGPDTTLTTAQIEEIIGLAGIAASIDELGNSSPWDGPTASPSGDPTSNIVALQAAIWLLEYGETTPGDDTTGIAVTFTDTNIDNSGGYGSDCPSPQPSGGCTTLTYAAYEEQDLGYFEGLESGFASGTEKLPNAYTSGIQDIAIADSSFVAVPEPAEWVMLLVGTAFAGGFMRRRKVSARVKTSLAYAFAHAKRR